MVSSMASSQSSSTWLHVSGAGSAGSQRTAPALADAPRQPGIGAELLVDAAVAVVVDAVADLGRRPARLAGARRPADADGCFAPAGADPAGDRAEALVGLAVAVVVDVVARLLAGLLPRDAGGRPLHTGRGARGAAARRTGLAGRLHRRQLRVLVDAAVAVVVDAVAPLVGRRGGGAPAGDPVHAARDGPGAGTDTAGGIPEILVRSTVTVVVGAVARLRGVERALTPVLVFGVPIHRDVERVALHRRAGAEIGIAPRLLGARRTLALVDGPITVIVEAVADLRAALRPCGPAGRQLERLPLDGDDASLERPGVAIGRDADPASTGGGPGALHGRVVPADVAAGAAVVGIRPQVHRAAVTGRPRYLAAVLGAAVGVDADGAVDAFAGLDDARAVFAPPLEDAADPDAGDPTSAAVPGIGLEVDEIAVAAHRIRLKRLAAEGERHHQDDACVPQRGTSRSAPTETVQSQPRSTPMSPLPCSTLPSSSGPTRASRSRAQSVSQGR
jgi:hypothetical protein